jgi:hypothetical protein
MLACSTDGHTTSSTTTSTRPAVPEVVVARGAPDCEAAGKDPVFGAVNEFSGVTDTGFACHITFTLPSATVIEVLGLNGSDCQPDIPLVLTFVRGGGGWVLSQDDRESYAARSGHVCVPVP